MFYSKYDDPYLNDDIFDNMDPDEDTWDDFPEGEEIPERIEWLEEVDNGELEDYSFDNDLDDLDLEDF